MATKNPSLGAVSTTSSQKPVQSLILDTGPLIKNAVSISTLLQTAEELFTVPAILTEVRDTATRSRVETQLLPFLTIRTPSPASMAAVVEFSKKTGDFAVLSKPDLQILALAYEIECERMGGNWRLRSTPGQKGRNGRPPKKFREAPKKAKEAGQANSSTPKEIDAEKETAVTKETEARGSDAKEQTPETTDAAVPAAVEPTSKNETTESTAANATSSQEPTNPDTMEAAVEANSNQVPEKPEALQSDAVTDPAEALEAKVAALDIAPSTEQPTPPTDDTTQGGPEPQQLEEGDDDDDDDDDSSDESDGEWITPSNIAEHQAKDSGFTSLTSRAKKQMPVATMTTDFAMQNVLLQMNLNLLSTNMQRIKKLRTTILRCHACFLTTKEMQKQFCPRCGQPTLKRVHCSTNAKGEFKLHLKKNFQWNTRGNVFSIPKPVGGSANGRVEGGGKGGWGNELILAEDQKEYVRAKEQEKRVKTRDLMDEDYLPGLLTGDRGRAGGRTKVGAGRNVNSKKRR